MTMFSKVHDDNFGLMLMKSNGVYIFFFKALNDHYFLIRLRSLKK